MPANSKIDISVFCVQLPDLGATLPAIHFPGGSILQPTIDVTRGVPSLCNQLQSLTSKIDIALAPFQPIFTLLDFVSTMAQCLLLVPKAISNVTKVPSLLECLGSVVSKLNAILALIPIFPQGIVEYITFVVDVIRMAGDVLDCLVSQFQAIEFQLAQIDALSSAAANAEPQERDRLLKLISCAQTEANKSTSAAVAILGPVARILCTIRSVLSLIPGGKEIAKVITIPTTADAQMELAQLIKVLSTARDVLLGTVTLLEDLAAPFGGLIPAPPVVFQCPLDSANDTTTQNIPVPTLSSVSPSAIIHGSNDVYAVLTGSNFIAGLSLVLLGTTTLNQDPAQGEVRVTILSSTSIRVLLKASDLAVASSPSPPGDGPLTLLVSNPPARPETNSGGTSGSVSIVVT